MFGNGLGSLSIKISVCEIKWFLKIINADIFKVLVPQVK